MGMRGLPRPLPHRGCRHCGTSFTARPSTNSTAARTARHWPVEHGLLRLRRGRSAGARFSACSTPASASRAPTSSIAGATGIASPKGSTCPSRTRTRCRRSGTPPSAERRPGSGAGGAHRDEPAPTARAAALAERDEPDGAPARSATDARAPADRVPRSPAVRFDRRQPASLAPSTSARPRRFGLAAAPPCQAVADDVAVELNARRDSCEHAPSSGVGLVAHASQASGVTADGRTEAQPPGSAKPAPRPALGLDQVSSATTHAGQMQLGRHLVDLDVEEVAWPGVGRRPARSAGSPSWGRGVGVDDAGRSLAGAQVF